MKILIVDTPEGLSKYLDEFVLHSGVKPITATNRDSALPFLSEKNLSLLILDFSGNLPDRSALYFEVVSLPILAQVPCLFLPTQETVRHLTAILHRPQDEFLLKPVTGAELARETARILKLPVRKRLELMVRIYLPGSPNPFPIRGKTVNLSRRGVLIRVGAPLPIQEIVEIGMVTPGGSSLRFSGVIRREERYHNEFLYGIELKGVLEGDLVELEKEYGIQMDLPVLKLGERKVS